MQHINSFTGGMKGGVDYSIIPQDSYTYMLNGCIISKDIHGFMVTNIKGTQPIAQFSPYEVPIGSVSFNGVLYIITHKKEVEIETIRFYSYKGSDGEKWIDNLFIIPNGPTNQLSISTSVLPLSRNKLLEVFAKGSYDGSVDIYINNGLMPNIVVNTGLDMNGKLTPRKYTTLSDPKIFYLQKTIQNTPTVTATIKDRGNMKPGTYFVYVRYEDESMNPTPFIKEAGPFFIHTNSSGVLNEDNARLNKSIQLAITNADTNYKKVSVGIAYYYGINGVTSKEIYGLKKSYTLINGACKITIDGDNSLVDLTLDELISDNLQYNSSETALQNEDRYFGANWKAKDVNYTKLKELASLFIPHAYLKGADNFNNVCNEDTKEFEYMEEEMYPLGVSFLIDGQFKTPVFPIFGWYENKKMYYAYTGVHDVLKKYKLNDAVFYAGNYYKNTTGLNRSIALDFVLLIGNPSVITKGEALSFLYVNSYTYESNPSNYILATVYSSVYTYLSTNDNYVYIQIQQ